MQAIERGRCGVGKSKLTERMDRRGELVEVKQEERTTVLGKTTKGRRKEPRETASLADKLTLSTYRGLVEGLRRHKIQIYH